MTPANIDPKFVVFPSNRLAIGYPDRLDVPKLSKLVNRLDLKILNLLQFGDVSVYHAQGGFLLSLMKTPGMVITVLGKNRPSLV